MIQRLNYVNPHNYLTKQWKKIMSKEVMDKIDYITNLISDIVQDDNIKMKLINTFKEWIKQINQKGIKLDILDRIIQKILFFIFMNENASHSNE